MNSAADISVPYAQCWVMRSAGLEALVAGGLAGERCT